MAIDFSWIYFLIFLIIPLTRIIPRIIAKRKMKNKPLTQTIQETKFEQNFSDTKREPPTQISKPQTKEMLVLGELNRGSKSFENLQKNTGFNNNELNSILEKLEKDGLMRVEQKQGLFGPKVELYPTEKGFKEYYS
ncbi:MAG: hypothetical protein KJO99_04990 [Nitrosopumilus sp.]|nr:hypothetical protein [Nitrosopumilus sp.]NNL53344.1 hypothetical protein [Nitrosopumilus sp.]